MKLNRTTLRRLIKEELTREVEEAQLDEIGGHGSAAGRAEADERFDAAIAYLQELIAGGAKGLEGAVAALRGGGQPGDTWHGAMNVGSPDARMGEGEVETSEDPLAEAGSFVSDRSGVIPQETIHMIMDFIGPEKWASINRDIQNAGGKLEMRNLADALGQYPELVAHLDEMGLLESGTDEGEETIDEDPVEEGEEVDEASWVGVMKPSNTVTKYRPATGQNKSTPATTSSPTTSWVPHPSEGASESLLDVLAERIESLSESRELDETSSTKGGFCADRLGTLCGIEED